jgi:branched-chain amino acid transport system ATP-binding protein
MFNLSISHISKNFGGVKAVTDFSLTAKTKQIIGIIGPNGAGKTTIFNLISGIYPCDSGNISLGDTNLTGMAQHEIALHGIARTFQNIRLFRGLSVLENVLTAYDPLSRYGIIQALIPTKIRRDEEKKGKELCKVHLEQTGILKYAQERPENLSYGLQRRLEIARALACNPKVLLLDEPAAGLNPMEIRSLLELLLKLHDELDIAILLIEHRLELIMNISEIIYVQNFGSTIAVGTPRDIQLDSNVKKAYLGEDD